YQVAELEGSKGFLDTAAVRARIDSPLFLAGVHDAEETALVHPARLAEGLAAAASELGVEIFEDSPARSLEASRDELVVRTDGGSVRAARVVLATNAFPALLRRFRLHTVPVFDYVLMTEPLTTEQRAAIGWAGGEGLADMANQFHYARPTADGRILWGGYDAIYHRGGAIDPSRYDRPETFARLASHFLATFPQLEEVRFSHRWSGVIDTSTRFCAFLAKAHGGRVAHVAGFTGLGVGASRFMALAALDTVDGLETERTRLRMLRTLPIPFPPEPRDQPHAPRPRPGGPPGGTARAVPARPRRDRHGVRLLGRCAHPGQCPASCQLRPTPTDTSSGTDSSAAEPICSRRICSTCS